MVNEEIKDRIKKKKEITVCRNRAVIRGNKTEICPKKGSRVMDAKYNFILFVFLYKESNKVAVCI